MIGDEPEDWAYATFLREEFVEWRRVLLIAGRAPVAVRLPVDEEWLEEFRLDAWEGNEPVYRSTGFVLREPREEGM